MNLLVFNKKVATDILIAPPLTIRLMRIKKTERHQQSVLPTSFPLAAKLCLNNLHVFTVRVWKKV